MGSVVGVSDAPASAPPRPLLRVGPMAVGAVLLALVVAASTTQAEWVAGAAVLPGLALVAALGGCLLALIGVRAERALAVMALSAPLAAYYSVVTGQPAAQPSGLDMIGSWWQAIFAGRAADHPQFLLFVMCLMFWLLVAWLVWGVVRRQQPLLGVAPAGAALATNVLNFPGSQDAYVFWFLVITLGLLLWSTYQSSLDSAAHNRLHLSEGARWDFWERGAIAMAALVALGVLAPPLSGIDRTVGISNDLVRVWGQITHGPGRGPGASGAQAPSSVGFSTEVALNSSLKQTTATVFTYNPPESAPGPSYFRGLNLSPGTRDWLFSPAGVTATRQIQASTSIDYAEIYVAEQRSSYQLTMLRPPAADPNLILYPGQLAAADRDVRAVGVTRSPVFSPPLATVDQVTSGNARGTYTVEVDQSTASIDDLRTAGTRYPSWVGQYEGLPFNYLSPQLREQIHAFALEVAAGATNPYDQAVAIETYLRQNYAYTLNPGPPPAGEDPLQYFLFTRKAGYCQYFATAMADMLRSLGVPTRLVNGYGPGTFDAKRNLYVVRESDAHTWPEVYFPGYGWIAFEPTPDGTYFPIPRGVASSGSSSSGAGAAAATPAPEPTSRPARASAPSHGSRFALPSLRTWTPVAAVVLVILALLYAAASRYLRPHTVAGVWRRATQLTRLAGVRPRPGDTPIEFGDRVAGEFPEAAPGMRQLAVDFAVAAYAPRGLAELRKPAVMAGWAVLRPILLRRVAIRMVPERRQTRRAEASAASPV